MKNIKYDNILPKKISRKEKRKMRISFPKIPKTYNQERYDTYIVLTLNIVLILILILIIIFMLSTCGGVLC